VSYHHPIERKPKANATVISLPRLGRPSGVSFPNES
jgi:hypothetical protein